jgi:hypothetical protein
MVAEWRPVNGFTRNKGDDGGAATMQLAEAAPVAADAAAVAEPGRLNRVLPLSLTA